MTEKEAMSRRTLLKSTGAGMGLLLAGLGAAEAADEPGASKKQKLTFHHVGIPTQKKHEDEKYIEDAKVYITDPEKHPYGIEWCRWMPGSESPELLRTTTHIAFKVDDVEAIMAGVDKKDVFLEPFVPFEGVKVAFINHEGLLVEFLEKSE